jgi:formylglycine-generating enzyme required for sulfatase activity
MTADSEHGRSADAKARIFISYSRKDIAFAGRLEGTLKARGFEPLIDREEIYAFEDWWKRIEALIGQADTIVFILSPDAVKSEVALKEVEYAASLNKRFAPVVCRRVEDSAVPQRLARLNFIFLDEPERFEVGIDRLVEALQGDIAWIRRHTEFGEAARRWIEAGRPGGLLLRPPVLDQAEAWLAFRPRGAPPPSSETDVFIRAGREAEVAARRRSRILNAALYTMLVGIILGLLGWINQAYVGKQWRWLATERPFMTANVSPFVLAPAVEQALKPGARFRECASDQAKDYCPEMIVVPAGSFTMGSPLTEKDRSDGEGPQHSVTIARPFAVARFEVTFDEWDTCVAYGDCPQGVSDGGFGRGQQPVIFVTWEDAKRYAAWLSKVTGKLYRLLTEAEYEYATRAGGQTAYPWGDDIGTNNGNCSGCGSKWDGRQPAPVGSFKPNAFGLYDMVGNVFQWVEDCPNGAYNVNYDGAPTDGSAWIAGRDCAYHVDRGGSWNFAPDALRSAMRDTSPTGQRIDNLSFRVARTLMAP